MVVRRGALHVDVGRSPPIANEFPWPKRPAAFLMEMLPPRLNCVIWSGESRMHMRSSISDFQLLQFLHPSRLWNFVFRPGGLT